jgi:hypothetical protein
VRGYCRWCPWATGSPSRADGGKTLTDALRCVRSGLPDALHWPRAHLRRSEGEEARLFPLLNRQRGFSGCGGGGCIAGQGAAEAAMVLSGVHASPCVVCVRRVVSTREVQCRGGRVCSQRRWAEREAERVWEREREIERERGAFFFWLQLEWGGWSAVPKHCRGPWLGHTQQTYHGGVRADVQQAVP